MFVTLFGIQHLDFKAKEGNDIKGLKLHYLYAPKECKSDYLGVKYDSVFVRPDFTGMFFGLKVSDVFDDFASIQKTIKLPCEVEVLFDLEGKKVVFDGVRFPDKK